MIVILATATLPKFKAFVLDQTSLLTALQPYTTLNVDLNYEKLCKKFAMPDDLLITPDSFDFLAALTIVIYIIAFVY